jgi:hypothetical protein
MNNDQRWLLQMRSLLHHNVPRFIQHIAQRGGVTTEEMQWISCQEDSPDYPEGMLARGDEYLLYPKNEEVFKKGLFVLVRAIAIMSFVPEGVRFLGLQFCSQIENFVAVEDGNPAGIKN